MSSFRWCGKRAKMTRKTNETPFLFLIVSAVAMTYGGVASSKVHIPLAWIPISWGMISINTINKPTKPR